MEMNMKMTLSEITARMFSLDEAAKIQFNLETTLALSLSLQIGLKRYSKMCNLIQLGQAREQFTKFMR